MEHYLKLQAKVAIKKGIALTISVWSLPSLFPAGDVLTEGPRRSTTQQRKAR